MMWPPGIGRNIGYISVIYGAHDKKLVHRSFIPIDPKQLQEKESSADTINNAGAIFVPPRSKLK